jgi:N-formylglutamate deformylase
VSADLNHPPFVLIEPTAPPVPVVASLPHSGTFIPPAIAATMLPEHIAALPNTDWHLDALYDFLPALGATVLAATHSRYVVDVNRALTPPLLGAFSKATVAEHTALGQPVYTRPPDTADLRARVEAYYLPFHERLDRTLGSLLERFGCAYLLDLHSFLGPMSLDYEVDLENRRGLTCFARTVEAFEQAFRAGGFDVRQNGHYTGGQIIRGHARPPMVEALQIEVRYTVYLDPQELDRPFRPRADAPQLSRARQRLRAVLGDVISRLAGLGR